MKLKELNEKYAAVCFNMLREKSEWINYKSYTMELRYGEPKSKPAIWLYQATDISIEKN